MSSRAGARALAPLALAAGAVGVLAAAVAVAAPGDLARVSLTDGGAQAAQASTRTAVSGDGRYVAFLSTAQLTGAATGGKRQLYVRDRVAGRTLLASSSAVGAAAAADVEEGDAFNPFIDISGDGRYAVFVSAAANLASGDVNGKADVFRKDLTTGAVELVSVGPGGVQANNDVLGDPGISYDGSRVVFTSGTATNLFAGDVSNASDILVRDLLAGSTTLVSQSTGGTQANGTSERPSISADGRVVAFEANQDSNNLFPADANAANDIVVRNLDARTTVAAAVATDGQVLGGSKPQISGSGRFVVFDTAARLDPLADGNMAQDVYRRDLIAGITLLVSARNGDPAAGDAGGSNADVSADGARVAFESGSVNLTTADGNAATKDVYTRDPATRATVRASAKADGGQGLNDSQTTSVSGNGAVIAFTYDDVGGKPLITGDTNAVEDVFAKEAAPTDATAPAVTVVAPANGATTTASQVTVSGTVAADPSGLGDLTVAGDRVPVSAAGVFSATVQLGAVGQATPITIRAVDGAGNAGTTVLTVTRTTTPVVPARPRATRITGTRSGSTMVVRFRLSGAARVRVEVLKVAATRPRLRLVRVGRPVVRTLAAGARAVKVKLPRRAPRVRYRVRVTVLAAAPAPVTAGGTTGAP